jgi:cellulose synthase/poly-beta-1,6-N-acetylglucosamine synthase-like glycosyltransferase
VALWRLWRVRAPRSRRNATATVILPLTGRAETLEELVAALGAQTLRPRRLVVAVESKDDPAYARILGVMDRAGFPVEIVVAGAAATQAQKCRNQQAALALVDDADEAIVLMDGDIAPGAGWLSALVSPLVDGTADLVTGHRWQMVAVPRLGAHLVASIDRAVTLMPRPGWGIASVVWGGSLAISRAAAEKMNLRKSLDGTLSDDLTLAERASAAGLRILTRGALLVPSPNRQGLASAWHFARRQYQIGRIYRPWLWRLAAVIIITRLAAWTALFASLATTSAPAWALVAMAMLAAQKQIAVGRLGASLGLADPPRVHLAQIALGLAQPVADVFHASVILAAAAARRVTWGHVVYRVHGPYDIRVEERRPFPAS